MEKDPTAQVTAALLTLSQGVDALYEVLRKHLSYQAEQTEDKLLQRFVPKALPDTPARYTMWQKHILDGEPIEEYKLVDDEF